MGLRSVLSGKTPAMSRAFGTTMYDATSYYGRRGAVIHAMSAVDIALWDLRGKVQGKPLAELLGTVQRDRVLAYGTVYPLGERPDEVRKNIDRGLALGLRAIKIVADPFWREDLDHTGLLIRTAREHVGPDIRLMVDAATAWSEADQGLPLMPLFKENDFAWVEAPLPLDDLEGHARFQGFGIPIGGGDLGLTTRFEYAQMFEEGRIDIAQPDVTMAGGLTELMRISALAKRLGRRVVTHGYKSNITIAANLGFLAQHWADEPCEYSTSRSPLRWELTNERLPIGPDGKVEVPMRPGLGRFAEGGDGRAVSSMTSRSGQIGAVARHHVLVQLDCEPRARWAGPSRRPRSPAPGRPARGVAGCRTRPGRYTQKPVRQGRQPGNGGPPPT
jgi:L-alanine-DL-glutamate epimerase-like enolase superfamily enzyme